MSDKSSTSIVIPDNAARRAPYVSPRETASRTPLIGETPLFFGALGTFMGYLVQYRVKSKPTVILGVTGYALGWYYDFAANTMKAVRNYEYSPSTRKYENSKVQKYKLSGLDGKSDKPIMEKVQ
eukprot:TRINITY_DN2170_c0_g1_i3.p1 TRINITY_DN2170_c0_g1~~TRINITY_DN2170_c0_g1_i3.p1  ORF type:complete len:124 (-),score=14.64 TRINITY_DN2170_c0_g1_i3:155-526(-)